jgi:undecaprenyl-diphosphatase
MLPYLPFFHALDLQLLYLINVTWSRPWLDPIMARVADFDSWKIPLGTTVVLAFIFGGFRWRLLIVMMGLCLVFGDGGVNWCFKQLVNRPRPMEVEPHLRIVTVGGVTESKPKDPATVKDGRSFTSGHACNNLALAIVASAIFGRPGWLLFPWAFLISYSRVYGANHYPSDILGSWIVSLCYTYAILMLADSFWRRDGPKKFPELYKAHPVLFPGLFP